MPKADPLYIIHIDAAGTKKKVSINPTANKSSGFSINFILSPHLRVVVVTIYLVTAELFYLTITYFTGNPSLDRPDVAMMPIKKQASSQTLHTQPSTGQPNARYSFFNSLYILEILISFFVLLSSQVPATQF
jgi:hypothetical protein